MSEADPAAGDGVAREAIGLDIGGTKIAGFRVTADGRVAAHALAPTPSGGSREVLSALEAVAGEVMGRAAVAVGVGVAGMVEQPAGMRGVG